MKKEIKLYIIYKNYDDNCYYITSTKNDLEKALNSFLTRFSRFEYHYDQWGNITKKQETGFKIEHLETVTEHPLKRKIEIIQEFKNNWNIHVMTP